MRAPHVGGDIITHRPGTVRMARYMLHIFEAFPGQVEPVLRERRAFAAKDDPAAIAEANRRYDNLAKGLAQRDPAVVLDSFVLYNGLRVVYERPRGVAP